MSTHGVERIKDHSSLDMNDSSVLEETDFLSSGLNKSAFFLRMYAWEWVVC